MIYIIDVVNNLLFTSIKIQRSNYVRPTLLCGLVEYVKSTDFLLNIHKLKSAERIDSINTKMRILSEYCNLLTVSVSYIVYILYIFTTVLTKLIIMNK
jgi:hypothetical protein